MDPKNVRSLDNTDPLAEITKEELLILDKFTAIQIEKYKKLVEWLEEDPTCYGSVTHKHSLFLHNHYETINKIIKEKLT